MQHDVIMPALGMNQDVGVIAEWHKQEGEAVKAGDIIMAVETDKAVTEIEARYDGYLTDVRYEAGVEIPVGQIVAIINRQQSSEPKKNIKKVNAVSKQVSPVNEQLIKINKKLTKIEPLKTGQLLASPKAKYLAHTYNIDLHHVRARRANKLLHADDVDSHHRRIVSQQSSDLTGIQFKINKFELMSCCNTINGHCDHQTLSAAHIVAYLVVYQMHMISCLDDYVVKVITQVGVTSNETYIKNPHARRLCDMQLEESINGRHDMQVLFLSQVRFESIKLAPSSMPTVILFIDGDYLNVQLSGFIGYEGVELLQLSESMSMALACPLLYAA